MSPRRLPRGSRGAADEGMVSLALPLLVWVATLVAILAIDLGAYFVAASRAQTLADHAALAAVSTGTGRHVSSPSAQAAELVARGDGRLESCRCPTRSGTAQVTVSVAVPGLVVHRLGAGRVTASGSAVLADPADGAATEPAPPHATWR